MTAPGLRVTVHVPEEGKPVRVTLPVAAVQVGWTGTPAAGADGVAGCGMITTGSEAGDVHPLSLVTVKV